MPRRNLLMFSRFSSNTPIYLDYQTTAPLDDRVRIAMAQYTDGNPASEHVLGRRAAYALDMARLRIARLIGAQAGSAIVFTSGAAENLELAMSYGAKFLPGERDHVITSVAEHGLAPNACGQASIRGFRTTAVPLDRNGRISPDDIADAVNDRSFLVALGRAQADIGTVQDIAAICRTAHRHKLLMYVDISRGVGHLSFNAAQAQADLVSLEAHRMCGPKGVGALYISRRLVDGGFGGHALRLAPVVPDVPGIVGCGVAADILYQEGPEETRRIADLTERLCKKLMATGVAFTIYGATDPCVPGYLNLRVHDLDNEGRNTLQESIALAYGSAHRCSARCSSVVLDAIGVPKSEAESTLSIGVGRFTEESHIDAAAEYIAAAVAASLERRDSLHAEVRSVVDCEGTEVTIAGTGYSQFCAMSNTEHFLRDLGEYTLDSIVALGRPKRINVVVPSYSSNHRLGSTLVSLLSQHVSFPTEILVVVNEPPDAGQAIREANDETEAWLRAVLDGRDEVPDRFSSCDGEVRAAVDRTRGKIELHVVRHVMTGGIPVVYQTALSSFIKRARNDIDALGGDRARRLRELDELCDRSMLMFCDDDIDMCSHDALEQAYHDAVVYGCIVLGRWRGVHRATDVSRVKDCSIRLMECFLDVKYDLGVNALPPKGLLLRHILEGGGVKLDSGFGDQLYFAQLASRRGQHLMDVTSSIEEADYASNGRMLRDLRLYLEGQDNAALKIFHNLLSMADTTTSNQQDKRYSQDDIRQLIAVIESRDLTVITEYLDRFVPGKGQLS